MRVSLSPSVRRALGDAPASVRKAFYKQTELLQTNLHHPSLRAKKYSAPQGRWQARVNRDWRFYFEIRGDTYDILDVIPHPK